MVKSVDKTDDQTLVVVIHSAAFRRGYVLQKRNETDARVFYCRLLMM